jgi:DNA-binding NtrC family response regulator
VTNKASQDAGEPPPKPWILVIDDENSILTLIEHVLKGEGWDVRTADGYASAVGLLNALDTPPAVVVCDVLMPDVDGLEAVRRMCARIKGLSVIFISGHLTDVSWWPADLREHRFLPKPFENAQLVAAVRESLGEE